MSFMMTNPKCCNNPSSTTRAIAKIIHISPMSVVRYLKTNGYMNRYDVWVAHELPGKILDRLLICGFLFKRHKTIRFSKKMIASDFSDGSRTGRCRGLQTKRHRLWGFIGKKSNILLGWRIGIQRSVRRCIRNATIHYGTQRSNRKQLESPGSIHKIVV